MADDIYHGYQCDELCPTCHPEVVKLYLPHGKTRRWRTHEKLPDWEFASERCDTGAIVFLRPVDLTDNKESA